MARHRYIGVLFVLLSCFGVHADTFLTNYTHAGLLQAIVAGGTITFSTNKSIELTNTITITNDIIFDGKITNLSVTTSNSVVTDTNGTPVSTNQVPVTNFTVLSLSNMVAFAGPLSNRFPLFAIATNATVTFDHVQLRAGAGVFGGAISNAGNVSNVFVFFNNNHVKGKNGAKGIASGADGQDGASALGGAIFNVGTTIVSRCYFLGNIAAGGVGGDGANGAGDSMFGQNGGRGGNGGAALGGAIYNKSGVLQISETTFEKNFALAGDGGFGGVGGIAPFPGVAGGAGAGGFGYGGAIYNAASITNQQSLFVDNGASGGDSMPQFNLENGVRGGAAGGGAVFNRGIFSMSESTVAFNSCVGGLGGGAQAGTFIYGGAGGNASGGGLYNIGITYLTNCTFASGGATNGLGGISLFSDGLHDGVPGASRGGNLCSDGGKLGLLNTIVAYGYKTNAVGILTDLGGNLSSDASCHFKLASSHVRKDLLLDALGDNGGYTFTIALRAGSPAIDGGINAGFNFDQRGTNRVDGKFDVGAFEVVGPFTVSGRVVFGTNEPAPGIPNVTIEVFGTNAVSQTTTNFTITNDFEGNFSFVVDKGKFTIVPHPADTNLVKLSPKITNVVNNITGLNFVAKSLTVKGVIANSAGVGMVGVVITSTNELFSQSLTATSGVKGVYLLTGVALGQNIITPSSPNGVFKPSSRIVSNSVPKIFTNINFTRIPTFTVSGVIGNSTGLLQNITILLNTNKSETNISTAVTDISGRFTFSNVVQGSYTVLPTSTELQFQPSSKFLRVTSDFSAVNFFATTNTP